MRCEWDDFKNIVNQKRHGVSFEEAQAVFDPRINALEIYDDRHSVSEERFKTIGPILRGLVMVVWTERDEDVVRIISARWATRNEAERYRIAMENES